MRILYAIQGTGNGHIARSLALIKELQKSADIDILISGLDYELKLPRRPTYCLKGLGFIFGQKGAIDYWETFRNININNFRSEIAQISVRNYNLVINDFEPVSIRAAKRVGIPTIGISNQAALLNSSIKKPKASFSLSKFIMRHYATSDNNIPLHYEKVDAITETPIIRDEIRYGVNSDNGTGVVYLPFYADSIIYNVLSKISDLRWVVFSKHTATPYELNNIKFYTIDSAIFTKKLLNCHLVITAAGFGTTSEALHLGKKMIVVPMKGQYEQTFNSFTLKAMKVVILNSFLDRNADHIIRQTLKTDIKIQIEFPDNLKSICNKIYQIHERILS